MRGTVLLIHPGALGDVLLALPAIRNVRTAFPRHAVTLMARRDIAGLLLACEEVTDSLPIEGQALAGLLSGAETIDAALERHFIDCEIAVAWTADSDHALDSVLRAFSVPRLLIGSPHASQYRSLHQADRFLETVKAVGQASVDSRPLRMPDIAKAGIEARLENMGLPVGLPFVLIHPGSGSPHKCVSPHLLAGVVRWCRENGMAPVAISGPADAERVSDLQRHCPQPLPVFHDLDLISMAGVLMRAAFFIGHDSGLTHLAACLHVVTVVLFGPTDPDRWAPRGTHVTVLRGAPCRCQTWEAVRTCAEKACLQIPLERIIAACASMRPDVLQAMS